MSLIRINHLIMGNTVQPRGAFLFGPTVVLTHTRVQRDAQKEFIGTEHELDLQILAYPMVMHGARCHGEVTHDRRQALKSRTRCQTLHGTKRNRPHPPESTRDVGDLRKRRLEDGTTREQIGRHSLEPPIATAGQRLKCTGGFERSNLAGIHPTLQRILYSRIDSSLGRRWFR